MPQADPRPGDAARPARVGTRLPKSAANEHTEELFTSLYNDLRRLAGREVRRNGAHDVLGTGTLVHEAWLDMNERPALAFDEPGASWPTRLAPCAGW